MKGDFLQKTKVFAHENRLLSWWHLIFSLLLTLSCAGLIIIFDYASLRIFLSCVLGLLLNRLFILYHDYYHRAILKNSKTAHVFFWIYGLLTLTPASVWQETHNFHHAHTSKMGFSNIGSFRIMTLPEWKAASKKQRLAYTLERSSVTILLGYFTVFLLGMCLQGFVRKPAKNWDGLLAIFIAFTLPVIAWYFNILSLYFFIWLLPSMIGAAIGSYLFYAQHNFPTMHLSPRKEWSYLHAALQSTCLIRMPKILHWFTGNIGFHHIHHANHKIPFYRLPEAMASLHEFQTPHTTSLHPKEIMRCLRLCVWDVEQEKMLTFQDLKQI